MRLLRAGGSAEIGKAASGSATSGLWLGDRKVGSQVGGEDRSRLPRRKQLGKLGEKTSQRQREGKSTQI